MERKDIFLKEETETGDYARALEKTVTTGFVSKYFYNIMGSTRLTKKEVVYFSLLEILKTISKINSLSKHDLTEESLSKLEKNEQDELKILWAFKQRLNKNICTLPAVMTERFQYMFGLGLQSLNGLSRDEMVKLAGGYRRALQPDEVGFGSKLWRRLRGDVLYPE